MGGWKECSTTVTKCLRCSRLTSALYRASACFIGTGAGAWGAVAECAASWGGTWKLTRSPECEPQGTRTSISLPFGTVYLYFGVCYCVCESEKVRVCVRETICGWVCLSVCVCVLWARALDFMFLAHTHSLSLTFSFTCTHRHAHANWCTQMLSFTHLRTHTHLWHEKCDPRRGRMECALASALLALVCHAVVWECWVLLLAPVRLVPESGAWRYTNMCRYIWWYIQMYVIVFVYVHIY